MKAITTLRRMDRVELADEIMGYSMAEVIDLVQELLQRTSVAETTPITLTEKQFNDHFRINRNYGKGRIPDSEK